MRLYMEYKCYSREHVLWITFVGLPSITLWIIGAPIIAFFILFKHRDHLEDGPIKKYFLILYQGLTRRAFYWEFVNTIRKVTILSIYTILSFTSIFYRVILSILMLIIVLRIQTNLRPFKNDINNELEMKATIVGALTLYWGILFEEDGDEHPGFNTMAFIFLLIFNILFFIDWLYHLFVSFRFKNEKARVFMRMFAMLLWKTYEDDDQEGLKKRRRKHFKDDFNEKPKKKLKTKKPKKKLLKKTVKGKVATDKNLKDAYFDIKKFQGQDQAIEDSTYSMHRSSSRLVEESKRMPRESILGEAQISAFNLRDQTKMSKSSYLKSNKNLLSKMNKREQLMLDSSNSVSIPRIET